jgi:endoglucanase
MIRLLAVAAVVFVVLGVIGLLDLLRTTPKPSTRVTAVTAAGLHVVGRRLENADGRPVVLRGVNRSGTEYACVHGYGIFDGPSDVASVRAVKSWGATLMRVPINEDCWLGINGVAKAYSGAAYRAGIVAYVGRLQRLGITPEVSLMWAAPGRHLATSQPPAPDADHSPAVWTSLARTFRINHNVILGVWSEPTVSAACFANGGVCGATYGPSNAPYRSAGAIQAVRLMRAAGFSGVIAVPGVAYANDLSAWLANEPRDPVGQIVAEAHVYTNQACATTGCLDRTMLPVARRVPLLLGEVGQQGCSTGALQRILAWAARRQVSWAAWTWDTWSNCQALISSYAGTPTNPYGAFIRQTLQSPA